MSVSTFASVASGKTFEGGDQVVSVNKTQSTAIIAASTLPVGVSYYVSVVNAGTLSIRVYNTDNSIGSLLYETSSTSPRTGLSITIPAGVGGLYITGTYTGPIIFQTIQAAQTATVSSAISDYANVFDYSAPTFKVVDGADHLMFTQIASTKKIVLVNKTTGTTTIGNIGLYDSTSSSSSKALTMAYNGTVLVATSGYTSSTTGGRIYYSSDLGVTWTASASTFSNSGATATDAQRVVYQNGYFILTGHENYTTGYLYSADGITWTTATHPRANSIQRIFYASAANLWVLWVGGGDTTYSTTPTLGGTWTNRATPQTTQPILLMFYFGGNIIVSHNSATAYYKSTDGINWTAISTALRAATSLNFDYSYSSTGVAVVGSYAYFGASNTSNNGVVARIDSSGVITQREVTPNTSDFFIVAPHLGSYMVYFYTSSYGARGWVIPSMVGAAPTSISGAPYFNANQNNYLGASGGYGGQYYFSVKFNRWYMATNVSVLSEVHLYYATNTGVDGIKGAWTRALTITSLNLQEHIFVETANSVGYSPVGGSSYYRSTNGTSFTSTSFIFNTVTYYTNVSGAASPDGKIVLGCSSANVVFTSLDDGLTWRIIGVSTSSGTGESRYVRKYSGGFLAISTTSSFVARSTDGIVWTDAGQSSATGGAASAPNNVVNDMLLGVYWNGTSTYKGYRGPSGVYASSGTNLLQSEFTLPVSALGKFFSLGQAIVFYTGTTLLYYTSTDAITWTARNVNQLAPTDATPQWSASGSDNYTVFGWAFNGSSGYSVGRNELIVKKNSSTLTIS